MPSATSPVEWNPFRPALAGVEVEGTLREYLSEQAANLREQHDLNQAGDTTYDVALLLQTSVTRRFTLGSVGRFYSENYGMIHARYVQFLDMVPGLTNPAPVGRHASSDSVSWVVTNDIAKSANDRVAGVGFFEAVPENGSFGWAVINGLNPFALTPETGVIPSQNAPYGWSSNGKFGLAVRGNVVGRRWGRGFDSAIGAGTLFICVEPFGPSELAWIIQQETANQVAEQAALEGRVGVAESNIASQSASIRALTTESSELSLRIERESQTRAREIQALYGVAGSGGVSSAELAESMNELRVELGTANSAVAFTANEALRVANNAIQATGGFDGKTFGDQLLAVTTQVEGIVSRLGGINYNLAGIADGQGIQANYIGTDSMGNPIFELIPVDLLAATRQILSGTGLTGGGDLSADRTLALADTAVTPDTYTYATVTVDQQGRITAASDGAPPSLPGWTTLYSNAALTNPTANIIVDVSGVDEIQVIGRGLTAGTASIRGVVFSVDGGVTYYNTAGDYEATSLNGNASNDFNCLNHGTATIAARNMGGFVTRLRSTGLKIAQSLPLSAHKIFLASTAPITHVKICSIAASGGADIPFTAGAVYVYGR